MNQLNQMLQQAQKLQAKMAEMQEKLDKIEVVGQSGAGFVQVTVNGRGDMKAIKIDPSQVSAEDTEVLEDLIIAAYRDAKSKMDQSVQSEMAKVRGDLNLPAGFPFP